MKVIHVLETCSISSGGTKELTLQKNEFYILSDDLHRKLQLIVGHVMGIEIPFKEIYNEYKGQDLNGKQLLAMRHGGGGDILFMTTGLMELYRQYPRSKLDIAISDQYRPFVEGNPDIHKTLSLPISLTEWNQYHYHLIFENLIENNYSANQLNAYDLFMEKMGLDIKVVPPERKTPSIFLSFEEEDRAHRELPSLNGNRPSVGIQVESSSPVRNYIPYHFVKVGKELINRGYNVFLFGSQVQECSINYIAGELGDYAYPVIKDLRTAIVAASLMNYFIAPDSMFIHIAGGFDVPVIGLYGPFHSDLRMKYFRRSIGINATTPCSPCFLHGHHPCSKGDPSPCLAMITPEVILQAFDEIEIKRRR